jgi:hypothetical protein
MSASTNRDEKPRPGGGIKVLRIGIVQNGKIIDERELKRRETVSIGSSQKATFQISSDALPRVFDLFEHAGGKYYLRFSPGMDGKVQLTGAEVKDLEGLKRAGRLIQRGDAAAVELSDDSRGKVAVGDITVLFQFKQLAAEPSRPMLPSDARGSVIQNIDAQFAGIFVLVSILQISLVTYARSLPYVEPSSIDQVESKYQKLIMPDRMPEPPKEEVKDTGADKGKDKQKEKGESKAKGSGKKKGGDKAVDEEAAARARKERLTKQVAGQGLLRVLGANSRHGGALNDVFSEGGAVGQLGDAFSGIQGVDIAGSGGERGTRGGGSGTGVGIGDLQTEGGGNVKTGAKIEASVAGNLKTEAPEVDGKLSESEINSVMKRQLKALRDCYEGALKRNRTLAGKLVIKFEIEESGRTQNIEFEEDSLGSPDVKECIMRRAKYWRFPKPDGGSVFVAYPIVFTPAS